MKKSFWQVLLVLITMTMMIHHFADSWEINTSNGNGSRVHDDEDDEESLLVNPNYLTTRMVLDLSKLGTSGTTNRNKPGVSCPSAGGTPQLYTTCLGLSNNNPHKPYCDPRNRDPSCQ